MDHTDKIFFKSAAFYFLAQSAISNPIAFQAIRFKQKGQRPDSYQPGATRQVERKQFFKG
jgi:hypothetical protein